MKIVDYSVVSDTNGESLSKQVLHRLKEGWQPLGGPQVASENGLTTLHQAMVIWEDPARQTAATAVPTAKAEPVFPRPTSEAAWPAESATPAPVPRPSDASATPQAAPFVSLPTPAAMTAGAAPTTISAQFVRIGDHRFTIFDAVDLPGGIAQLSCTLASGDSARLQGAAGQIAEFDEKGKPAGRGRIINTALKGTAAIISIKRMQ